MAQRNWSFKGRGPIYMEEIGGSGGLQPVGNVSALEVSAEVDEQTQPDYTQPSGGLANSSSSVSNVSASMTFLDFSPANFAKALRGAVQEIAGGTTVTAEQHTASKGALIPFEYTPDLSDYANTLTVTLDPGGTATTATEGTDYEVTRAGIVILDSFTGTDGDTIEVSYDKAESSIVQALVEAGKEYRLVFDGLNEAQSGKAVTVVIHRLKLSPTSGLALIGDEFGEMPVEGEVLSDPSITGTGISRFMKIHVQH